VLADETTGIENSPVALQQARRDAMLEKYKSGARLSPDQLAEIASLVNPVQPPIQPTPSEPSLQADLLGEVPKATAKHNYQHELSAYVTKYETCERGIKRWIKAGRDSKPQADFPPLDEPAKMASWWARHMKHRVPAKLLLLAAPAQENSSPSNAQAVTLPEGEGMESVLERLRLAERTASAQYVSELAKEGADAGQIEILERRWGRSVETLRKAEISCQEVLKSQGAVALKTDVEKELFQIHSTIALGVRSLWSRLEAKVGFLSVEQKREIKKLYDLEVDNLFTVLRQSRFVSAEVPL
jgi:hypothetical protein